MKEKNRRKYPILLAAAVLVPVTVYGYITETVQKNEKKLYSVVLYQDEENEWAMLEAGAEQAKDDARIMINYVHLDANNTTEDEVLAIQREAELGTSGVLVACSEKEKMKEELKKSNISVPMVFIESGVGEEYPVIRADDYQMGKTLGKKVLSEMLPEDGPVIILGERMDRDSMQSRYRGVTDALKASGEEIEIIDETGKKTEEIMDVAVEVLQSNGKAVTLDKYSTEQISSLWEEYQNYSQRKKTRLQIYGIGNTAATVNDLDNENLAALVYQNEFSMGYQGIMALTEKREADWINENIHISYNIVTKETLYDEEHARLLFPNS